MGNSHTQPAPRATYPDSTDAPHISDGPEEVMRAAFFLQTRQNLADREWAKSLGISEELAHSVRTRLAQRGGVWLDFIASSVGYAGDFESFSDDLIKAHESHLM